MKRELPKFPWGANLLGALIITVLIFLLFSSGMMLIHWTDGIPYTAQGGNVRTMNHGDHLQLMYHYFLMSDFMSFQTPFMYNLYEFNLGDDSERKFFTAYFFPFSAIWSILMWFSNRATAWNLLLLLSSWMYFYFTWRLMLRFTTNKWAGFLGAVTALVIPYRWEVMYGGSPTATAMMLIPAYWYFLDMAIRKNQFRSSIMAGIAILFLGFCDAYSFYFSMLFTPVMVLLTLLYDPEATPYNKKALLKKAVLLMPMLFFVALSVLYSTIKKAYFVDTIKISGSGQIGLFSPNWMEIFMDIDSPTIIANQIHLGRLIFLFVAGALLLLVIAQMRNKGTTRKNTFALVVFITIVGTLWLACGIGRTPFGIKLITYARQLIPMYDMVRQPAKIYCMLPLFMGLMALLGTEELAKLIKNPKLRPILPILLTSILVVQYSKRMNPSVCLLHNTQEAYAAVAEHSHAQNKEPHALVVPFWPGDADWTSIYQHYASLYRVRMINGYYPVVKRSYKEDVFEGLKSVNQGLLDDRQIDLLLERGIDYLILHEHAFPMKVSCYPPSTTLRRFLSHPRIEALEQDGNAWSFRLLKEPRTTIPPLPKSPTVFPSRVYEAERMRPYKAKMFADRDLSASGGAILEKPGSRLLQTSTTYVSPEPGLRWMIRVRGKGAFLASTTSGEQILGNRMLQVDTEDWTWMELPMHWLNDYTSLRLGLIHREGRVEIDVAMIVAGTWKMLQPGEIMTLPAPAFFHHAHTDMKTGDLVLRAQFEDSGVQMRGPRMPFAPGQYEVMVEYVSTAPTGTALAFVSAEVETGSRFGQAEIIQGTPFKLSIPIKETVPVSFLLHYAKQTDLRVRAVNIRRVK